MTTIELILLPSALFSYYWAFVFMKAAILETERQKQLSSQIERQLEGIRQDRRQLEAAFEKLDRQSQSKRSEFEKLFQMDAGDVEPS